MDGCPVDRAKCQMLTCIVTMLPQVGSISPSAMSYQRMIMGIFGPYYVLTTGLLLFGRLIQVGSLISLSFKPAAQARRLRATATAARSTDNSCLDESSKRPHKHKDRTKHDFWYAPHTRTWNQNVRSLCLCGLVGPYGDPNSSFLWRPTSLRPWAGRSGSSKSSLAASAVPVARRKRHLLVM